MIINPFKRGEEDVIQKNADTAATESIAKRGRQEKSCYE